MTNTKSRVKEVFFVDGEEVPNGRHDKIYKYSGNPGTKAIDFSGNSYDAWPNVNNPVLTEKEIEDHLNIVQRWAYEGYKIPLNRHEARAIWEGKTVATHYRRVSVSLGKKDLHKILIAHVK